MEMIMNLLLSTSAAISTGRNIPPHFFQSNGLFLKLSRNAPYGTQKSLRRLGKRNNQLKSRPISDQEINMLYEKGILGAGFSKALLNTIWINCKLYGL
jgi:hypothetical protein